MSTDSLQYAPLTQSIVRSLTDKLYEKRKAAALEIEKQVRELVKNNNYNEFEKIIIVLETLTLSSNTNSRKGGLIGLAATAIALGKNISSYSSRLMEPVFLCFADSDPRVRYFACESLYNIVKICRVSAFSKFGDLFDILWKLTSDTDQNVRSGSELLDRLIKEIVVGTPNFDLEYLMVLIRERIYTINSSNRRFIITWLSTVLTIPNFSIKSYIPEVIDGIFKSLDDSSQAVRDITISVLTELLEKLDPESETETNIGSIINTMVIHTSSTNTITRKMAIIWLNEICKSYDYRILPNLSAFLISILPFIGDLLLKADELNQRLMDLIKLDSNISIDSVVEVLLTHLKHDKTECRIATLNWICLLHSIFPSKMFCHMDRFFPFFLELLLDSADEVLMLDITLISDICGQTEHSLDLKSLNLSSDINDKLQAVSPYLIKFCVSLLKMFKNDSELINERGFQIIRQICLLLNPADVYRSLAVLLSSCINFDKNVNYKSLLECNQNDLEFIGRMVAMLSRILLTTFELFHLRQSLRNPIKNNCSELFEHLYRCWSYQPICLVSLCLLSQNYYHAVEIVHRLANLDITLTSLKEIDHLVQLLESPIFAFVRMDLLNAKHQKPLASVFSALLMLLPQTDAFNTLHKRLQTVPNLFILERNENITNQDCSTVKFQNLLAYFDKVTLCKKQSLSTNHKKILNDLKQ